MTFRVSGAVCHEGKARIGKLFDRSVDVFGYNLGYYEGDYTAAGLGAVSEMFHLPMQAYTDLMGNQGLYNGNIAWMATNLAKIGEIKADPLQGTQAMLYQYDQLHRITQSRSLTQRDENEDLLRVHQIHRLTTKTTPTMRTGTC